MVVDHRAGPGQSYLAAANLPTNAEPDPQSKTREYENYAAWIDP